MNIMTETRKRNTAGIIAVVIAAALIGVFALMLSAREGATDSNLALNEPALPQEARYPQPGDKFAPEPSLEVSITGERMDRCHGEGLMDTQIRDTLTASAGSVARYCEPQAQTAGGQDETETDTNPTGTSFCAGEGLMVPMDPFATDGRSGSLEPYCLPDGGSEDHMLPADDGPGSDPRNY